LTLWEVIGVISYWGGYTIIAFVYYKTPFKSFNSQPKNRLVLIDFWIPNCHSLPLSWLFAKTTCQSMIDADVWTTTPMNAGFRLFEQMCGHDAKNFLACFHFIFQHKLLKHFWYTYGRKLYCITVLCRLSISQLFRLSILYFIYQVIYLNISYTKSDIGLHNIHKILSRV